MTSKIRISRDAWFVDLVRVAATRSTCPRLRVGAVLVKEGMVVGVSYNGAPTGQPHCDEVGCYLIDNHCVRAVHAEINILMGAARYGISTENTQLWLTHTPCVHCVKAIIRAGVKRVIYLCQYLPEEGLKQLAESNIIVQLWSGGPYP